MAKLIKKTTVHYKGKVHDLKVENSHTYNIEGIAVHNSGAGSLVNYLLGVTQVDPLKYNLLWERFLGRHRCLKHDTLVMTSNGPVPLSEVNVGTLVLTHNGELKPVTDRVNASHDIAYKIKVNGQTFTCAPNHKWIVERDGHQIEIMACELKKGDSLVVNDMQAVTLNVNRE